MIKCLYTLIIILLSSSFPLWSYADSLQTLTGDQYNQIILNGRKTTPDMLQSLQRHFRDSNKNFLDPIGMSNSSQLPKPKVITGSNYILSPLFPWNYKFETFHDKNTLVIRVKIHFKEVNASQLKSLKENIKLAEGIWNKNAPTNSVGFKYRFQFDVVTKAKDAFYSVGFLKNTRGPFYKNWSQNWKAISIAHEIGHMMGLSDEYNEVEAKGGCIRTSLMCDGWYGHLMAFHYYHILRKVF